MYPFLCVFKSVLFRRVKSGIERRLIVRYIAPAIYYQGTSRTLSIILRLFIFFNNTNSPSGRTLETAMHHYFGTN